MPALGGEYSEPACCARRRESGGAELPAGLDADLLERQAWICESSSGCEAARGRTRAPVADGRRGVGGARGGRGARPRASAGRSRRQRRRRRGGGRGQLDEGTLDRLRLDPARVEALADQVGGDGRDPRPRARDRRLDARERARRERACGFRSGRSARTSRLGRTSPSTSPRQLLKQPEHGRAADRRRRAAHGDGARRRRAAPGTRACRPAAGRGRSRALSRARGRTGPRDAARTRSRW